VSTRPCTRRHPSARRRGGAGILFFVMFCFPVLMAMMIVSVDTTSQIMATNQVQSVASAAARAGALQQRPSSDRLNRPVAESVARQVFTDAVSAGVLSMSSGATVKVTTSDTVVTVAVTFTNRQRTFIKMFFGSDSGAKQTYKTTARTCSPNQTNAGRSQGRCAVPYAS
jgi:Flp pilus assembly protein TadG